MTKFGICQIPDIRFLKKIQFSKNVPDRWNEHQKHTFGDFHPIFVKFDQSIEIFKISEKPEKRLFFSFGLTN